MASVNILSGGLGWGRVESGKQSDVLMKAHVPYISNSQCIQRFAPANVRVYETYLCAGGKNKTDTCNGDSGKMKNI